LSVNLITIHVPVWLHLYISDISPEVINQIVNEGETALFICQATGAPILNIYWYFNGVLIDRKNTTKYFISEISNPITKRSTLTVMNVGSTDTGTYTCSAFNDASSDTSSGVLTLNSKDIIAYILYIKYLL